jgi:AraC-like DNA-binding protein
MENNLTGMARLGDGMIRAGNLQQVPALLKALGARPSSLLRAAGLAPDALSRPENVIPVSSALRFLTVCAERTGRPHFGLLAGQRVAIEQYGLVGLRMLHAPTVGVAWRGVVLTLHLNGRAMVPALTIRDRLASLSFAYAGREVEGAYHAADLTLAAACTVMRVLCGPTWAPTETHIGHRDPIDSRPYRQFFRNAVRFGASRHALLFPAALLDRPIAGADSAERRKIEQVIADMLRRQDLELTSGVRRALFAQMTQDDVSIEGVARLLGMHKRTLNRRLAEQGTSFATLLGEVRFQIASQLLTETDLSFTDVAAALNYTDASAFSRAFRSWAGMSPSKWRQEHTAQKMPLERRPPAPRQPEQ